jgi:signal recognition particle receptor subunit beta
MEIGENPSEADEVASLLSHLDDMFLVVVVGEVKSGKSFLVNTLLRADVCEVGPTPVTDRVTILKHGEKEESVEREEWVRERTVESERLRGLCVVDTPGTNSIVRRHEEITRRFLPQADLVLFVTSCDRPYTESENQFLHLISERWRRKIVFVLSKTDIKDPGEVEEIRDYVRDCCRAQLGFDPVILPVAAKPARAALEEGRGEDLDATGLPALEEYVLHRLNDEEKTRLRLFGLLDGARSVLKRVRESVGDVTGRLEHDHRILAELEKEREEKRRELKNARHMHLARLSQEFTQLREQGEKFIDQRHKLFRLPTVGRKKKVEKAFREEVIQGLDERIAKALAEAVFWLGEETLRFYHYSLEVFTHKVRGNGSDRPGPPPETQFETGRERILDGIRGRFIESIEALDPKAHSRDILGAARRGMGISAAGLGAGVLSAAVATALVNLWWSAIALPFLAVSLIALGVVRGKAQRNWAKRVSALEQRFKEELSAELESGIDQTIDDTVSIYEPFLEFYHAEVARMDEEQRRIDLLGADLDAARDKVENVTRAEG